jgi:hypothetical protein
MENYNEKAIRTRRIEIGKYKLNEIKMFPSI